MNQSTRTETERIQIIRLQLMEFHPFWGHLLMHMSLIPTHNLQAFAATDCVQTIWYNPDWTAHLNLRQLGYVLAHELGHVVFLSHERRHGRDEHLWNCATDYAINRMVSAIGHPGRCDAPLYESPSGQYDQLGDIQILDDRCFDGRIAEAIYEQLTHDCTPNPHQVQVRLSLPGCQDDLIVPGVLDHGGGIDLHLPEHWASANADHVRGMLETALNEWRRTGGHGHIPGHMRTILDSTQPSKQPWHMILRQYLDDASGPFELTYRRPNRRYLDHDVIQPTTDIRMINSVIIAIDTSASMDDHSLTLLTREIEGILPHIESVTLLIADAKIHAVIEGHDILKFLARRRLPGGGGTSHLPIFEWIEHRRETPDLFIGLTDLYSRFPPKKPIYPVLWIVPPDHGTPPWGTVISTSK